MNELMYAAQATQHTYESALREGIAIGKREQAEAVAELTGAVRNFLERYDAIEEKLNGVFSFYANHGGKWSHTDNWVEEMHDLRTVLAKHAKVQDERIPVAGFQVSDQHGNITASGITRYEDKQKVQS